MRIFALIALLFASAGAHAREPVDWVNPEIGMVSHVLVPTYPATQLPNAMFRFTAPMGGYEEHRIFRLRLFQPRHRGWGIANAYPFCGEKAKAFDGWSGTWDQLHARPERFSIYFDREQVSFSLAPASHSALATIRYEAPGSHGFVLMPDATNGHFHAEGSAVTGHDWFRGLKTHFRFEFDRPFTSVAEGTNGMVAVFFDGEAQTVGMRYAVSYISGEQAADSLRREIPGWDERPLVAAARKAWNAKLSKIEVEGGTDDERTVFYTALWRCYERMVDISEYGRYRGWDGKVHDDEGRGAYTDDWVWDTYRAAHPLMVILEPKAEGDKMHSYLRMSRENREGWMPTFPDAYNDSHRMNGFHIAAVFLDAWRKGVRDFDIKAVYSACAKTLRESSMLPWRRLPKNEFDFFYDKHGFYPGLRPGEKETNGNVKPFERRQSVVVSLGRAYDSWCVAELGKEAGCADDVTEFAAASKNYLKLWRADTGFFHPKDSDCRWIEPFDYTFSGGFGARDYYDENNAWTYIWDVQHDIPGLIDAFGGKARMSAQLDRMLGTLMDCRKSEFWNVLPDSSGNMGMFCMGNEPSFHVPYLYNYTGEPWKTQQFVRKVLKLWFRNDLMGICGDEDGGGMSAFAVFSMMGFYPVTPGLPEYQWGSPVFRKVVVHQENGNDFTVSAPDASEDVKYIHAITVGGKPREGMRLMHGDIVGGKTVVLRMSDRPKR